MKYTKHPVFFGCDFDPNPDIGSIRRKLFRYIQAAGLEDIVTPYDIFVKSLDCRSKNQPFRFAGKYPCPGWISAAPKFDREIYPEMYRKFIDEGGCLDYTAGFGQYVVSNLAEGELPISIGVDHCLAGGVVRPLSQTYNDLIMVTFDAHLDAFSPYVRNNLVGYMREHSSSENDLSLLYEFHEGDFKGSYDTGSFLYYLVREGTLPGNHLMVFGIQDEPAPELWEINDQRVRQYLDEYEWLKSRGVVIGSLEQLNQGNVKTVLKDLEGKLIGRNVYLSVDIDVFKGKVGTAARYSNNRGLTLTKMFKILSWLGLDRSNLVGMDIMELDVNSLILSGTRESEVFSFFKQIINGICREAGVPTV